MESQSSSITGSSTGIVTEPESAAPPSGWYEFPPSFAQRRLWFLHQVEPQSPVYNAPWFLRLTGALDRRALEKSLRELVRRHESLRTKFPMRDGEPVQQIHPPVSPAVAPGATGESALPLVDLSQLSGWAREEAARALRRREATCPFDLECGPLIRFNLVRLADREHELLVTIHHIVSDGWSKGILMRELCALYEAFLQGRPSPLPEPSLQYADYSIWQRDLVQNRVFEDQLEYWSKRLADVPLLDLPTRYPRSQATSRPGAVVTFRVPRNVSERLQELKQSEGATSFVVLLAAFQWLLGLYANQEDVSVGTVIASRSRKGTEDLVGFLLNTLVIRTDLGGEPSFRELIRRVRKTALEAYANQDAPFDQIIEVLRPQRRLGQDPLLQVAFSVESGRNQPSHTSGLRIEEISAELDRAKFEVLLGLQETSEDLQGELQYAADLYDRQSMEQMARHYRWLIEIASAEPDTPLTGLSLIEEPDWLIIQNWNRTERAYPSDRCVQELFERKAEADPQALALIQGSSRLTYHDLNRRANQLAHYLLSRGVGPEVPVGLCLNRGVEMIVGMLAILKAGGAYVPLDPSYPADRLEYMVGDIAARLVITEEAFLGRFWDINTDAVSIESIRDQVASLSPENPHSANTGDDLAYVIYTSGSTGAPKGIMVSHRAISRLVINTDYVDLRAGDRIAQISNASFDAATFEIWGALLNGAAVVVIDKDIALSPADLSRQLRRERVTAMFLTTALFNQTVQAGRDVFQGLRYVLFGGEAVDPRWVGEALGEASPERLLHVYGPTETTTFATWFHVREVEPGCRTIPIGGPIANTRAYVLDEYLQPAPPGLPGEIYIGGPGVARGYWRNPELTAGRFVPDPFSSQDGERLYRTGDRARYGKDGAIEFLGRTDDQVKLRGYRIEIGEIEASLKQHEAVKDAVVALREDGGERRLVGYVVGKPGEALMGAAIREWLKKRLPDYMAPTALVVLPELPLNANGKVDRQALPPPGREDRDLEEYVAPQTELEAALCRIWADLLKLDRVGRHDNFFELGGHSLLVVRALSQLRQSLGVEVPLADFYARPVLADFARTVERSAQAQLPPIKPADRSNPLELSFAQQRLWFLAQFEGASEVYHIAEGLRLKGEFDRAALRRALDRIVARHEALRATFSQFDGRPAQIIGPAESGFALQEHDLRQSADAESELRRLAAREAAQPFDLERGPLIRGRLAQMADDDHALLLTMHHIVSDGWSMGVLADELSALYRAYRSGEAASLPDLPIQYADYAAWQRRYLTGEVLHRQAEYWKKILAGAPALLELPTDRPRPAQQDFAGDIVEIKLDAKLTRDLKGLSRRQGMTLYMTLLAGWAALLARLSGQEEVVIGSPVANRLRLEIEPLIGFFVNTLAMRIDVSGSPTVVELLGRVRARALEAQQHQDIPFEQVVEIVQPPRSLAHAPVFQVMLAWQNAPEGELDLPGLTITPMEAPHATATHDMTLSLQEEGEEIIGCLEYATALFERETARRYLRRWRRLLEGMVVGEMEVVERLPLLGEAERRQALEEWNATEAEYPKERCVHELFEEQVEKSPEAIALVCDDQGLSYSELNARANRLAHHLRGLGVEPGARVAICVERSLEMVVALLATLKAGGAYVPLDSAYPRERLAYMLEDSSPVALLTDGAARGALIGNLCEVPILRLDIDAVQWAGQSIHNPGRIGVGLDARGLAYVMYTSGSTGLPKGVMIEHRGVCNQITALKRRYELNADDRILQFASMAFDVSVEEIFSALLSGATLELRTDEWLAGANDFYALCETKGVSVINLPPAFWQQLVQEQAEIPATVRQVIIGSEAVSAQAATAWFGQEDYLPRLSNAYGPTEATVNATIHEMAAEDLSWKLIGRPIANTRIYLIDGEGQPAPIGARGEIYINGAGIARGYLNRPDLTVERFVADPFAKEPGARMYKTGDLARYQADGKIEFLGRNDFQVKIRGFRIEPGEVEAKLIGHPGVREAVVMAREEDGASKWLVAYYTGEEIGAEALRAHLSSALPEYMLPSAYIRLESLPLTPNGKLDRRALHAKPAPEWEAYVRQGYEPPMGETETLLARIWADLLKLDRVGRHDNFFELGGHSLLAVRLKAQVRERLGFELPQSVFFTRPTIAGLAAALDLSDLRRDGPLVPLRLIGERAPLFLVHAAGGGLFPYRELTRALPARRPIYGLERPGFESGEVEELDVERLAARYLEPVTRRQPHGPYAIAGWSFGGMVAFEMARQLRSAGEPVAFLGLIDTRPPLGDALSRLDPLAMRMDLDTNGLFDREARILGETLNEAAGKRLQAMLDAHERAMLRYAPGGEIDAERVALFRAVASKTGFRNSQYWEGWQSLSRSPIEQHTITGDHYSIMEPPQAAFLAEALARALGDL